MEPIIVQGQYGEAKIYATTVEPELINQCINLLNHPMTKDNQIRIMPDTHAGKGCMIGTTMQVKDETCVNLVGMDISCGMLTVNLGTEELDFDKIDQIITDYVPLGFNTHQSVSKEAKKFFETHKFIAPVNLEVPMLSLGTLGGGNHFIEIDRDPKTKENYLVIHTGSRNLGKRVAEHWHSVAINEQIRPLLIDTKPVIDALKAQNRHREIQKEIEKISKQNRQILATLPNKELATLSGKNLENYLTDMKTTGLFATKNRKMIANAIVSNYFGKPLSEFEHFETVHNYIDTEEKMLRKGAISAKKGEVVLIPLNMRDGCLIAIGKGNKDWNQSAPHGAGRLMSRSRAKQEINLEDFIETMEGIYSSSINESTLDEAPFVYKDAQEIIDAVKDTVEIINHIKPLYNRKA